MDRVPSPEAIATWGSILLAILTSAWAKLSGKADKSDLSKTDSEQQSQITLQGNRIANMEGELRDLRILLMNADAEKFACEFTTDENGIILTWDERCTQLFGYRPHEVKGKPLSLLMPRDVSASHERAMQEWRATSKHLDRTTPINSVGLTKLNERFDLTILSLVSFDDSSWQPGQAGTGRKCTARVCRRY